MEENGSMANDYKVKLTEIQLVIVTVLALGGHVRKTRGEYRLFDSSEKARGTVTRSSIDFLVSAGAIEFNAGKYIIAPNHKITLR